MVDGAGVGGLAAAGALATSGWQVTLLEHGDRLRGTGGAQVLWPNGAAALHALGLHLGDISFAMPAGGIRRPDGRWIVESTADTGDPLSPYLDHTAAPPPPAVTVPLIVTLPIAEIWMAPPPAPALVPPLPAEPGHPPQRGDWLGESSAVPAWPALLATLFP